MTHFGKWLGVLVASVVVGCGPVTPEEMEALALEGIDTSDMQATVEQVEDVLNSAAPDDGLMHAMDVCPADYTCPGDYSCGSWSTVPTACTGSLSACTGTVACRECEMGPNGKPICWQTGTQKAGTSYLIQACNKPGVPTCYSYKVTYATYCGCFGI
ncbi:hypothetical protein [Pyxidicoccus trucidator]|uniref:hypothetical protein n=1 Tax=Pyxidicoccus trucidator TaxID=2709662 RepID=UPI0013DCA3D3|nr:hypothetical protein [Pyxidicoccus trucidator]